jgi:Tfp pilus assembly protein FimV
VMMGATLLCTICGYVGAPPHNDCPGHRPVKVVAEDPRDARIAELEARVAELESELQEAHWDAMGEDL